MWSLRRRVRDRASGLVGTVRGRLLIEHVGADELTWAESGLFSWTLPGAGSSAGRQAPVTRTLRLARDDGQWWMRFADGSPFHPWRPGEPVEHPCRADLYTGRIDIAPDGESMRTLWDVAGPAKDQRLITVLTRIPA